MRSLMLAAALLPAAASAQSADLQTLLQRDRVCALTRDIRIGIDRPEPGEMLEVVRKVERDGRSVWRAIHYPVRIVEEAREGPIGFDLTDIDAATLRPLESEARYMPDPVRFDYAAPVARRLGVKGEVLDTTRLGDRVPLPWYPGSAVLNQAVPWRDGLRAHGYIVDNYSGKGDARLRRVEVEVTGRASVAIGAVTMPAYRVVWRAADGFVLHERISVARPHQTLEFDYYPTGTGKPMRSRVAALADGADCATIAAAGLKPPGA